MDYQIYSNSAQAYPFIGLSHASGFTHPEDDPSKLAGTDPLDASFLSFNYDAFPFGILPTANTSSPPAHSSHAPMPVAPVDNGYSELDDVAAANAQAHRESSEEKGDIPTPAQSRRKAQNRAAQRAFRERKERHVKDLEAQLTALQSSASTLRSDNEQLKLALQRAKTENEILRASTGHPLAPPAHSPSASSPGTSNSDEAYSTSSHLVSDSPLLSTSAAWDLIQSHPLVKQGVVDIADVCEQIRPLAKCNGQGPVYEEREVWKAVENSRRAGGDTLI